MTSFAISTPQLNLLLLLCGKWTKLRLELELRGCCFSAAAAGEGREEFIQQGPAMLVVPVQVTPKLSCFWANQYSRSGKQRAAWGMRPSFLDSLFSLLWGGGKVSWVECPLRWGAFGRGKQERFGSLRFLAGLVGHGCLNWGCGVGSGGSWEMWFLLAVTAWAYWRTVVFGYKK